MKKNMGTADRLFRLAIGLLLLSLGIWQGSWVLAVAALFCFYEAAASWCVLYQILGKNTCSLK
jgi:hypothetical protein